MEQIKTSGGPAQEDARRAISREGGRSSPRVRAETEEKEEEDARPKVVMEVLVEGRG